MYVVVLVTASHKKEAQKIGRELLKKKLVACVNISEKFNSLFWWQGKIDQAQEVLLIIKSKKTKLAQIIKAVKSLHSYQTPEIIALPIVGGSKDYLGWIDESLR